MFGLLCTLPEFYDIIDNVEEAGTRDRIFTTSAYVCGFEERGPSAGASHVT